MKQFKFGFLLLVCSILLTSVGFASTNVKEKASLDGVTQVDDNVIIDIENAMTLNALIVFHQINITQWNERTLSIENVQAFNSDLNVTSVGTVKELGRQVKGRNILHQLGTNKDGKTNSSLAITKLTRGAVSMQLVFYKQINRGF